MTHRVHNFGAGPAALPRSVLAQAQDEMLDYAGTGMSVLELSHRSAAYESLHAAAVADLRALLGLPESYQVLFMGGGARTQFALVPMNLCPEAGRAEYLVTGHWAAGALAEAQKLCAAASVYSSESFGHDRVPSSADYAVRADSAYLHYTSNNTIYGTQFHSVPVCPQDVPLVCDMSSDLLSRPLDIERFGVIYAAAQKNLGPAGVTLVIVHDSLLTRSRAELPEMFSYARVAAKSSLLNTPPVYAIYMLGKVARHLLDAGGLTAAAARNEEKARIIYARIDASGGFYRPHAQPGSRSLMNVTFRLPDAQLEQAFLDYAAANEMVGLRGHRSVGGIRVSLYNAVELASVQALDALMAEFMRRYG